MLGRIERSASCGEPSFTPTEHNHTYGELGLSFTQFVRMCEREVGKRAVGRSHVRGDGHVMFDVGAALRITHSTEIYYPHCNFRRVARVVTSHNWSDRWCGVLPKCR